jgi:hypothetical protein
MDGKGEKNMQSEKNELLRLSRENLDWFNKNYSSLRRKYNNQWVAIQKKEVIANGSTYDQVVQVLKECDKKSAVIEFMDSKRLAMFF